MHKARNWEDGTINSIESSTLLVLCPHQKKRLKCKVDHGGMCIIKSNLIIHIYSLFCGIQLFYTKYSFEWVIPTLTNDGKGEGTVPVREKDIYNSEYYESRAKQLFFLSL